MSGKGNKVNAQPNNNKNKVNNNKNIKIESKDVPNNNVKSSPVKSSPVSSPQTNSNQKSQQQQQQKIQPKQAEQKISSKQQIPVVQSKNNNNNNSKNKSKPIPIDTSKNQVETKHSNENNNSKKSKQPDLFDAYASEPALPPRKIKQGKVAPGSPAKKRADPPKLENYHYLKDIAFQFNLPFEYFEDKTNSQIKSKLKEELKGYGVINEIKIMTHQPDKEDEEENDEEEYQVKGEKVVHLLFSRILEKGALLKQNIEIDGSVKLNLLNSEIELIKSDEKPSGGGKITGTDKKSAKETNESSRGGFASRGGPSRGALNSDRGNASRGKGSERGRGRGG